MEKLQWSHWTFREKKSRDFTGIATCDETSLHRWWGSSGKKWRSGLPLFRTQWVDRSFAIGVSGLSTRDLFVVAAMHRETGPCLALDRWYWSKSYWMDPIFVTPPIWASAIAIPGDATRVGALLRHVPPGALGALSTYEERHTVLGSIYVFLYAMFKWDIEWRGGGGGGGDQGRGDKKEGGTRGGWFWWMPLFGGPWTVVGRDMAARLLLGAGGTALGFCWQRFIESSQCTDCTLRSEHAQGGGQL